MWRTGHVPARAGKLKTVAPIAWRESNPGPGCARGA
jgi:hypothetical protein